MVDTIRHSQHAAVRSGRTLTHVWQSCKNIGAPGLRVDVVHLGGDDQGIHEGSTLAAAGRTGEEPRLAAKSDPTQGAFGSIVRQADAGTDHLGGRMARIHQ